MCLVSEGSLSCLLNARSQICGRSSKITTWHQHLNLCIILIIYTLVNQRRKMMICSWTPHQHFILGKAFGNPWLTKLDRRHNLPIKLVWRHHHLGLLPFPIPSSCCWGLRLQCHKHFPGKIVPHSASTGWTLLPFTHHTIDHSKLEPSEPCLLMNDNTRLSDSMALSQNRALASLWKVAVQVRSPPSQVLLLWVHLHFVHGRDSPWVISCWAKSNR